MRERGWSDAKIDRWLESRAAHSKRHDATQLTGSQWVAFLTAALELPSVLYVALLMRVYKSSPGREPFTIRGRVDADVASLVAGKIPWSSAVLYDFRREREAQG